MRVTHIAVAMLCTVFALGFLGCSEVLSNVEVTFQRTVPAARALEIHNTAGIIDVVPWNQPNIEIDAKKHGLTLADAQAIAINVASADGKVVITTDVGDSNSNRHVLYTIHAPANEDLTIDETAGNIHVMGWTGSIDASQTAGNLDVTMARLNAPQHVALNSTTGNVVLNMPSTSSATIDAQATVGSVSVGDFGLTSQRENLTGASAHGKIGNGSAQVKLTVTTGAISLHQR